MATRTICAVATPPGRGGIGVIRLSGPAAGVIAASVAGELPPPREARFRRFRNASGEHLDEGLCLYFPGPHSFTGEDVVELQGHGGPVVMDRLLQALLAQGATLAEPGEFSERAFLNGRMDLTRAEAIADLIEAGSEAAAKAAMRSLAGAFAETVHGLVDALTGLRVHLESSIDFTDEPLEGLALEHLAGQIGALRERLAATQAAARQGQQLREGLTVVIAGRPNAGKSSLLNALAGRDAAIVTAMAGTTRDVLDTHLHVDGLPLRVLDTAGLRESTDVIEQEGVRRAQAAMAEADRILLVIDDREADQDQAKLMAELPSGVPVTQVLNKIDLSARTPGVLHDQTIPCVAVSALTGEGMNALRTALRQAAGIEEGEAQFIARRRHLLALEQAAAALEEAEMAARDGHGEELIAESLRVAQDELGRITGMVTTEDLLGEIFSTFCIGK